jgi:hypothetical protein
LGVWISSVPDMFEEVLKQGSGQIWCTIHQRVFKFKVSCTRQYFADSSGTVQSMYLKHVMSMLKLMPERTCAQQAILHSFCYAEQSLVVVMQ